MDAEFLTRFGEIREVATQGRRRVIAAESNVQLQAYRQRTESPCSLSGLICHPTSSD
jgi:hypothetical protein